ncbi:MAG: pro-sigmaK processing inhibitor BofA family protein [Lachnospiraceae bacterium]|nr:pro-sigmaK processing inhibitor BofA family protein [Lachnospiraceae bacterium]
MERICIMILIALGGLILLIAIAVRGEMENLLCFLMRGLLGSVGICVMNLCLARWGQSVDVGINAVTFLTTATLGIPGFLGLYALGFYQLL